MEEWRSSAWVEMETVRATIDAAARGEIVLNPRQRKGGPDPDRELSLDSDSTFRYHATDVAIYLGWTKKNHQHDLRPDKKCAVAFLCLDAIRDGLLTVPLCGGCLDSQGLRKGPLQDLWLGTGPRSLRMRIPLGVRI
jgi:hypothetical protein